MDTHLTHPSPLQPLLHSPPAPPAPPPPHPGAPLRMWFGATVAPELKSEPEEGNEAPTDTLTVYPQTPLANKDESAYYRVRVAAIVMAPRFLSSHPGGKSHE